MKICSSCRREKPQSDFHKDVSRSDGLSNRCKRCRCKYPETIQKRCVACGDIFTASGQRKAQKYCGRTCQQLHIRYGIDEYKYEDLLISSNYKCAICGEEEKIVDARTGKIYELSIDHCHDSGKVRGILCGNCNAGIGHFKDDIGILKRAILYLENSKDKTLQ